MPLPTLIQSCAASLLNPPLSYRIEMQLAMQSPSDGGTGTRPEVRGRADVQAGVFRAAVGRGEREGQQRPASAQKKNNRKKPKSEEADDTSRWPPETGRVPRPTQHRRIVPSPVPSRLVIALPPLVRASCHL